MFELRQWCSISQTALLESIKRGKEEKVQSWIILSSHRVCKQLLTSVFGLLRRFLSPPLSNQVKA